MKAEGRPITMLTCYDAPTAGMLAEAGIDALLVGDSLAQVILGYNSTCAATMDLMVTLTAAVRRGAPGVFLMGDMPFLSYQVNAEEAIRNAGRFLREAGCDAVKMEVDIRHLELVRTLATAGIPVAAHLGYRPQTAQQQSKIVATREADKAIQVVKDALAMVEAGATMLLLECVCDVVAQQVTRRSGIPVISCGSGPYCDGQVLVLHDALGLPGGVGSRFSKFFGNAAEAMVQAADAYIKDVRAGSFPDADHSFHMKPEQQVLFEAWLKEQM